MYTQVFLTDKPPAAQKKKRQETIFGPSQLKKIKKDLNDENKEKKKKNPK